MCHGFLFHVRERETAARGVEVKEFSIAAPVDGGFKLALGFIVAELLVEHVKEEVFRDGVVAFAAECAGDLAQQQHVLKSCFAEKLLLAKNLRVSEVAAGGRNRDVAFLHFEEAEKLCGLHNGE